MRRHHAQRLDAIIARSEKYYFLVVLLREIYEVHFFACNGFKLLFVDNREEDKDQH